MRIDSVQLTTKEKLFCEHYLINGYNKYRAAISAKYSKKSAHVIASENFKKPKIKKYLEKRMKDAFEKMGISMEYKIGKLKKVADTFISDDDEIFRRTESSKIKLALDSVGELNKMQGHYAAQKQEISMIDVSDAKEAAEEAEKEISSIKEF